MTTWGGGEGRRYGEREMGFRGAIGGWVTLSAVDHWVTSEGSSHIFMDFLFPVAGLHWRLKMISGVCYKRKKYLRFILRGFMGFLYLFWYFWYTGSSAWCIVKKRWVGGFLSSRIYGVLKTSVPSWFPRPGQRRESREVLIAGLCRCSDVGRSRWRALWWEALVMGWGGRPGLLLQERTRGNWALRHGLMLRILGLGVRQEGPQGKADTGKVSGLRSPVPRSDSPRTGLCPDLYYSPKVLTPFSVGPRRRGVVSLLGNDSYCSCLLGF